MSTILSFDPGYTTGWCIAALPESEPINLISFGQIEGGLPGFVEWCKSGPAGWDGEFTVVSELFINDGRTNTPNLEPLRIEGALEVLFPGWIGQRNAEKVHASDEVLEQMGWYESGARHAMDAMRHAIAYAKHLRHIPTMRLLKPPRT